MRQRVARVAVVAVLVALILLAVPLALVIKAAYFADERGELERDALEAAVRVGPEFAAGDPVELPPAQSDRGVGLYDGQMRLRAGTGPDAADATTRRAAGGKVVHGHSADELVVAVPVSTAERVIGVVRASAGSQGVWNRVLLAWLALLGAALVAFGAALLVARRQARALTAPLEALSRTSQAVADGDLTARAATCGIAEIDQVAGSHNAMVQRLARLLQHERDYAANASHQLRTPLTGLQLGLETALTTPEADLRAAAAEALEQSRHLQHTIDEVLRLAKAEAAPATHTASQPAGELLERAERRWHDPFAQDGRRIRFTLEPGTAILPLPSRAAEQILDILLDNARKHGRGSVEVALREVGDALALDIADEGTLTLDPKTVFDRGTTTGPGTGIGLALARDLAETAGGRLTLAKTAPTIFTLLLPHPG
ncbi:sensor histidine kinase [Kitasatospora atroaurantiaca]|uniref:histidine kinase n=1 Tax=Kitasatospora atroaurantiaca TaxID=285545 RepID=A0A561EJ67_9ACTN|nr:HAMP domain-containing sensor histidine kinase [Kitasatospora atroaurantiaca]TWE15657.1 signal transduction histidine kinase [Kitasatospora atroaurantiaca]